MKTSQTKRLLITGPIAAIAIAIGAMTVGAPLALAIPEGTIQSECDEAGGNYTTGVDKAGNRDSNCTYTDNTGNFYQDSYVNGAYTGTVQINATGPKKPVPRPTNLTPLPSGVQSHPAAP